MLPSRWAVALSLALIASGIVLIIVGSRALDSPADRRTDVVYAGFIATGDSTETSSTESWSSFSESPDFALAMDDSVFTSFYLWNLTNGPALLSGSDTQPKVQQIGPYVYQKRSFKRDIQLDTSANDDDFVLVTYRIDNEYSFVPERSNGTEMDVVITANASYVRRLSKLRSRGYSERFLVAEYAHQHLREYSRHLRGEFLAQTKQRALRAFIPDLVNNAKVEALPAVMSRQSARAESSNLPNALVKMMAIARTEQIPLVLRDIYKNISDGLLPGFLSKSYAQAKIDALPRVLSNMYERLQVEGVPVLLERQFKYQKLMHVPRTLSSLWIHLQRIAFPYVMREVFDRACLEAVPFILRSIKSEIVARDIASNRVTADVAQASVVERWRLRSSSLTDFDAWIDNTPTSSPRTGFELLPTDSTLQLSTEVATLLLGSKPSNLRFSIVDYDADQTAASLEMDEPIGTPEGFAIWKQVIAMNETAIAYVIEGVNNDVALTSDYLTRSQLLFVRDYLMTWATNAIIQRDRQRYWRAPYIRRTGNSDVDDPDVDLDYEMTGIQAGFRLAAIGASSSLTTSVSQQLWNESAPLSFTTPKGFTKWLDVIDSSGGSSATQVLLDGVDGLTTTQITAVTTWISGMLNDGFISRRALRHWSDGTCQSVMRLDLETCILYDLEPLIDGYQGSFELNPLSDSSVVVSQTTRELVWGVALPSSSPSMSFLLPAHPSDTNHGFGFWMQAIRTSDVAQILNAVGQSDFTEKSASAIVEWLREWGTSNFLNEIVVTNWWTKSTCLPREPLRISSLNSVISIQSSCDKAYDDPVSSSVITTTSSESPFFTMENTYNVDQTECEHDSSTSSYTVNHTTYILDAQAYSCDAISTSLADDQDELTIGFELSPLITSESDRVPIAAALALEDPSSSVSFMNLAGFHRWFILTSTDDDDGAIAADTSAALLSELNDIVTSTCTDGNVGGGGTHSAVFNTSISAAACSAVTSDHVMVVAEWLRSQMGSKWVKNALMDQWRRGLANEFDIEPYRPDVQSGLELECGCISDSCSLSTTNRTEYVVPRKSMLLWDANGNSASFLTYIGASLWQDLSDAIASNTAASITAAQSAIATAFGVNQWEQWMATVFDWLESWKANEHLVRDIAGHWLYAQCPTTPTTLQVVNEASPVVLTQSTCPSNGAAEYQIQLNDSVLPLQVTASRPIRFFDPEVADNAAKVQPKIIVEATETWITCEEQAGSTSYTETTVVIDSIKEVQACNLLRVLATSMIDGLPNSAIDDLFELNSSSLPDSAVTTPDISIPVAVMLWEQPSNYSVASESSFVDKWFFAIDGDEQLDAVASELNAIVGPSDASNLTAMQQYLVRWESSDLTAEKMSGMWLSTPPFQDLDPSTDGAQIGLELRSSRRFIDALQSASMPTMAQAKPLWHIDNKYSFLRMSDAGTIATNNLPVGFAAWKEIFEGADDSSEELVDQYPLKPTAVRKQTMTYTLTQQQQTDLLSDMATETSLSATQLRAIAIWLFKWTSNSVLRDYVIFQWATGKTPRGSETDCLNLSKHISQLFGLTDSGVRVSASNRDDVFSVALPSAGSITKPKLRYLWSISTAGSIINPASQVLWCVLVRGDSDVETQIARYCQHLLDDVGDVTDTTLVEFEMLIKPLFPQVIITRASNLTQLALAFSQLKFGMEDEQTLSFADWYRSRPKKSLFYQVYALTKWKAVEPTAEAALIDPVRNFGFDLANVFPWENDTSVSRSATRRNLISNTVVLPSDSTSHSLNDCSMNLELLLTLWDSSNRASFLNPLGGVKAWLYLAKSGDISEFLEYMNVSTAETGNNDTLTVIDTQQLTEDELSCTLQAVSHWVLSWYNHPWLKSFVELLWLEPIASSSSFFFDQVPEPTLLLSRFRLPPNGDIALSNTSWPMLARLALDSDEDVSIVDPYEGYSLFQALMVNCSGSNEAAKCSIAEDHVSLNAKALAALDVLVDMISKSFDALVPDNSQPSSNIASEMVQQHIMPWLISLLDSDELTQNILEHVQEVWDVEDSTAILPTNFGDLAAVQFVNASITRMNFTLSHRGTVYTDSGRASERMAREDVEFVLNSESEIPVQIVNSSFTPGLGELRSFCADNSLDARFSYDVETASCGLLDGDYTLLPSDVEALWAVFAEDSTEWTYISSEDGIGPQFGFPPTTPIGKVSRVAVLIDAFLAQPFESAAACNVVLANLGAAYADLISPQQVNAACVEEVAGGQTKVWLSLPMLDSAGFSDKPSSFTRDFQAYLRYAATKFVYEPSVLGLKPQPLVSGSQPPNSGERYNPIGGMVTATSVVRALFGSENSESPRAEALGIDGMTSTTMDHRDQKLTLRSARQYSIEAFSQRSKVVGEVLEINGSLSANVWGKRVPLEDLGVTDGSQFTTAVLTGRTLGQAGRREYPPTTLQFFWPRARRLVQLEFSRNITRFGASLMRYIASDWTNPSSLPTGVEESSLAIKGVNMTYQADELPLVLQGADSSVETVVDIDPVSGLVYHTRQAWQIAAVISGNTKEDGGQWHTALPLTALPVLWVNEEACATPDRAMALARVSRPGPFATEKIAWWGIVGGSVYICVGIGLSFITFRRARMIHVQKLQRVSPATIPHENIVTKLEASYPSTPPVEQLVNETVEV